MIKSTTTFVMLLFGRILIANIDIIFEIKEY